MAETRRVELQTISAPKEEKNSERPTLIPRFNLALGESTASTCPEFSFTELLKKEKADKEPAVNDAFGDEDDCHDEVAALARKFEEKYGPKPSGKKRKLKCLEDDYYDMGDGYDENDPFIDNTEAYDEVIPSCLTTIHGGFYINRGTLDFRTLSDQEDSGTDFVIPVVKKRGRPRKIVDSEDSGDEGEEFRKRKLKKKKGKEGLEGEKKKKRKLAFGPDGEKIKRKKLINPDKKKKTSPTVQELLKHQTVSTGTPSAVNGSTEDHAPSPPHHSLSGDKAAVTADKADGSVTVAVKLEGEEKETDVQLPSDLPADLETAIVDIKKAAKDSKEGKCKFFSPHVNKLLLDIELASRQLAPGKRPMIYAHLADHLPCGKETLIKRAKKLRENQQDDKLKAPIQRLKEEIDRVMPALQEQHERDVARARLENKEKRDGGEGQKEEGVNTESDEDEKNATSSAATEGQSRKGNRDPRKKFKWTSEIKSLLCEIVRIKMHMFDTYKFRNQTAEEYLKTFLDNEIKILWPQGWIQTRTLFKETRSVHGSWTNPPKPKRQVLGSRSTASPTPNTGISESATSPNVPPANAIGSGDAEVIEVSDIDEPLPIKDTAKTVGVSHQPDTPRGAGADSLKFSPNTMEAIASATAAALAAAVSSPKSEAVPSLGERRPHLMTEMLKRPGNTAESSAPFSRPPPASTSLPKTPPAGDSAVPNFMAEFNRYLSSSSSSMPPSAASSSPPLRQGPTSSLPSSSALPQQAKTVSPPTGRLEDSRGGHTLPTGWKMDEGVGTERKPNVNIPPPLSTRPPNAHKGPPLADMNQYRQYKLMSSVLKGSDLSAEASGPVKTKNEEVRDQILARIQAEIDSNKARKTGPSSGMAGSSSQQQRQAHPPPAHASQHSPMFPSPSKELGGGSSPAVSRPPPSLPVSGGMGNASVPRQQAPTSLPGYTSKQAGMNLAMAGSRPSGANNAVSVSRPSGVNSVSRPSGVNSMSRPSGGNMASVSRPPGVNTVSRPPGVNVVSRSSPVARQSPKAVTQPSPGHVTTQAASALGRQSPKTLTRPSPGGGPRLSPSSVTRPSPPDGNRPSNMTRPSPPDGNRPSNVTRQSPSNMTRTAANNVTRPSPSNMVRAANAPSAMSGVTRNAAGTNLSQSPSILFQHSSSSSAVVSHPSQQRQSPGGASLSDSSAPAPSVCVRPLSLTTQKKTPPQPSPSPLGAGRPSPQPSLITRVVTATGQGQSMVKGPAGQGQVMKGQGHHTSQARVVAGQSLLQKSSPPSMPAHRGLPPSSLPPEGGHKVGPPLAQGMQNLPRAPPGGIMSRGQLVGSSSSSAPPRTPVRPGSANVLDMHNRASPSPRSQGDKAAAPLPLGGQAGSTPHSRPPPRTIASPTTNAPRLQQPAAAAGNKGVANKPPVTHSGSSATPPHPSGLDPQAVLSSGLFNHRPVFRPLHSLSATRFKDPPKPSPGPGFSQ